MRRISGKPVAIGIVGVLLAMVIIAVVVAVIEVPRAYREIMAQERRLHSMIVTSELLIRFVENSDPQRWPSSWDELEESGVVLDEYWPAWPADRAKIEQDIKIEFSLTLSDVAIQTEDSFTAVAVKGSWPTASWAPAHLLDSVREVSRRLQYKPPDDRQVDGP